MKYTHRAHKIEFARCKGELWDVRLMNGLDVRVNRRPPRGMAAYRALEARSSETKQLAFTAADVQPMQPRCIPISPLKKRPDKVPFTLMEETGATRESVANGIAKKFLILGCVAIKFGRHSFRSIMANRGRTS
jgi:hypothetical protein